MKPYILAISGASAQPLAERSLELLLLNNKEVDLVISKGSYSVWQAESGIKVPTEPKQQEKFWRERLNINKGILRCHRWNDQTASIASGSYITKGMLILPCSMGLVGRISSGFALDLIERCADVHLKEKRPLILAPREMPWSLIHLKNLTALAEAGAHICPPIPAWYTKPNSLEDMIDFLIARIFDCFDEDLTPISRWTGPIK